MQPNPIIFKSYDIRGVYPEELNEGAAFQIGRNFVRYTGCKNIAIGKDARLSSDSLFKSLADGITSEGANVFDVGQVPTECLYFTVGFYNDIDGGIMITASHNPKEYNGFKMIKKSGNDVAFIRGKDLLLEIKIDGNASKNKGKIGERDMWPDYIKHILSFADLKSIRQFKVAIDASNGVAGIVLSKIGEILPIKIFLLNYEPDGNFPNHSPNPLMPDSINQIRNEINKVKAEFGFVFDGDADRIFLVDEKGELIRADVVLLLLAKYFLQKNPGFGIAYNAVCSKAVPEFVKKWGGLPIRTQVGFANVREGLIQNNGIVGGELSGHYCFKDNFYLDSGMIALLALLQIISQDPRKVSEIVKELSPYIKPSEINFEIKDKDAVIEKIKQKYPDGKQDYLDGVTVEYSDWWFNVRASNTEPLLRLTIEANTLDLLEAKQKELTKIISTGLL